MQDKPHSEELFLLLGKIVPRVAVEIVILQKGTHKILLTKRPKDDTYWPNQWHVPGGYIWHRERIVDAITRISKRELGVSLRTHSFLGVLEFENEQDSPRNHTISLVYICTPVRAVRQGKYFSLDAIPKPFIQIQQSIIDLVKKSQQQ